MECVAINPCATLLSGKAYKPPLVATVCRGVLGLGAHSRFPHNLFPQTSVRSLVLHLTRSHYYPSRRTTTVPAMIAIFAALVSLALTPVVHSAPTSSLDASVFLQNGKDAQALNAVFANISTTDSCNGGFCIPADMRPSKLMLPLTDGEMACVTNSLAHCVNATWQLEACSDSLSCFAVPSVREKGTVRTSIAH